MTLVHAAVSQVEGGVSEGDVDIVDSGKCTVKGAQVTIISYDLAAKLQEE